MARYNAVDTAFVAKLREFIPADHVFYAGDSQSKEVIEEHSADKGEHTAHPPDVVVYPASTEEVSKIVKLCGSSKVPITPCGAQTGLESSAVAIKGGVLIDTTKYMNKVIELMEDDLWVVVQPGILKTELNEWLAKHGLCFYPDPASDPSIGGQASTGASGTTSVKYGTFKENVVSLQVVFPNGEIIDTRRKVRKNSTGYDLTHLVLGAEGTMGIITELTLRVGPPPKAVVAGRCFILIPLQCMFDALTDAAKMVVTMRRMGLTELARCEILNIPGIHAVNKYNKTSYPAKNTLFLEFHASDEETAMKAVQIAQQIAKELGGGDFQHTADEKEREILWDARRSAYYAGCESRPVVDGVAPTVFSTDVCISLSNIAEVIRFSEIEFHKTDISPIIVGHVADVIRELQGKVVGKALAVGGSASGEHGVGIGKAEYMLPEHGEASMAIMRALKKAVDPQHIMNPDKIFVMPE